MRRKRRAVEGGQLWDSLPEELLHAVVRRLESDQKSLIALRSTNRQLKWIVGRHVESLNGRFNDLGLQHCSKACPQLRQLTIRQFSPLTNLTPLAALTQLSKLCCAFTKTLGETRAVRSLPDSLRELDIRGTKIGGRGLLALNLPHLRVLDVRDVRWLARQDVLSLLSGCNNLEVLGISGQRTSTDGLWARLGQFPKLRVLKLSRAWFDRAIDDVHAPKQLERLDISFCSVANVALKSLLRSTPRLKFLSLDVVATQDWDCCHEALEDLQLFVPPLKLDGFRLPALKRLWVMPLFSPGPHFLSSLRALSGLTSLLLAELRDVSMNDMLLGRALIHLPLKELALIRCGKELEMSAMSHLKQLVSLESLSVVQLRVNEEWSTESKSLASTALSEAPRLRLLMGQGAVVDAASELASWVQVQSCEVLAPRLKHFARHGGTWLCYARPH